jgi:hypothetical protein
MRPMLFLAALSMLATSAFAAEFPTFNEFKDYSAREMRAVPDVKVPLGKAVKASGLKNKSEVELLLMKNSIYAQAGYSFKAVYLKNYFESRTWYRGGRYDQNKIKSVDRENSHVIGAALAKMKRNHGGHDGGDGYDGYDSYDGYGYGQ